jgi:hypothetical protein
MTAALDKIVIYIVLALCPVASFAHGGGVDKNGGHFNRKSNTYHCHREPCLSTATKSAKAIEEAEREGRAFTTLYNRSEWPHWIDSDNDCQDTRVEILIRDSVTPAVLHSPGGCKVSTGTWVLPYSGKTTSNPREIDIDHVIPLKWAHGHGGDKWSRERKREFANDPANLLATDSSENRSKGSKGPDAWLPRLNRCKYANDWTVLIAKYSLELQAQERLALDKACPS